MITVDVPRAVAWTRVSHGGRKSKTKEELIRLFGIEAMFDLRYHVPRLGFFETELGSVYTVEGCDGGRRVWR